MIKSIIIFGASDDCKSLLDKLYPLILVNKVRIEAICDNDSRIHGHKIYGYNIISPDELHLHKFDKIIVTPIFFLDIKKQLLDLGVDESAIKPYNYDYKNYFDTKKRVFGNNEVGRYSYFKTNTKIWNTRIGSFCHIGDNCMIGQSGHDVSNVTTYPLRYHFSNEISDCSLDKTGNKKTSGKKTIIKNDVYIGEGVTIQSGVSIGNGAVIASKAYVTKDVDDYCIVGGVPARPIKKRFSEDTIAKLLAIKWWKYDSKKINSVINILENDIDEFLKIQNFESKK